VVIGCMGSAAPCARRRAASSGGEGSAPRASAPREGGLPKAILDETAHSRALILGREQPREQQPLDLQAGAEAGFQTVVDACFAARGQRRAVVSRQGVP